MELHHLFLSITQEAVHTAHMNIFPAESSSVTAEVLIVAKHQRVISSPPIRIDDRTFSDGPHHQVGNGLSNHILKRLHFDQPFPLENTEDRKSGFGIFRAVTLTSVFKIGSLCFNLPVRQRITVSGVGDDRLPDEVKGLVRRGIRDPQLLGGLSGSGFQLK